MTFALIMPILYSMPEAVRNFLPGEDFPAEKGRAGPGLSCCLQYFRKINTKNPAIFVDSPPCL